jgi:hypothetical protein
VLVGQLEKFAAGARAKGVLDEITGTIAVLLVIPEENTIRADFIRRATASPMRHAGIRRSDLLPQRAGMRVGQVRRGFQASHASHHTISRM